MKKPLIILISILLLILLFLAVFIYLTNSSDEISNKEYNNIKSIYNTTKDKDIKKLIDETLEDGSITELELYKINSLIKIKQENLRRNKPLIDELKNKW